MPASREQNRGSTNQNEGEGSRTAAQHYEQGVRQTVASGRVDQAARAAARALASPEGPSLRRAEAEGKKRKASRSHRSAKVTKH